MVSSHVAGNRLDKHLFILGAARCGTTFLRDLLNQHHQLFMSVPKEPMFFEAEYERGCEWYLSHYFPQHHTGQCTGEARHRNLLLPYIARRIAESVDDPRFVVVLRNPVERTFSHWWHWYSRGVESRSFEAVISLGLEGREFDGLNDDELARVYPSTLARGEPGDGYSRFEAYIASSRYAEQIQRYLYLFGSDRLFVIFHDDLKNDPVSVVRRICEFLKLDPINKINLRSAAKNRAKKPGNGRWVRNLSNVPGKFLVPPSARRIIVDRINSIGNPYRLEREKNLCRHGPNLYEYFQSEVEWLERWSGRDLQAWKR